MPHSSGSGLNAPGGCLSKPTTSAVSALPAVSIACAVISAEPPVAQPFLTLMNGTPVRPSTDTVVSALPAASEPPAAKSTCSQPMPASASAARAAWAAISRPETPGWRPNGMDAEPDDGDVVAHRASTGRNANVCLRRPARDQRQLHLHPDPQLARDRTRSAAPRRAPRRAARRSPTPYGSNSVRLAGVGRRLRTEALDRPVHSVPRRARLRSGRRSTCSGDTRPGAGT